MTMSMKIPTVSKFLFYFDLSKSGLVLGWFEVGVYGLGLLFLLVNVITGFSLINLNILNEFSILDLTIDAVVQIVLLVFFFGISLAFVKGVVDRSPKLCLPFVVLTGLEAGVFLMESLVFQNVLLLIVAAIKIYLFIFVFSLYQLLSYGDEQAAYEAHQNANSAGYEQYYEPETSYSNIDKEEIEQNGYQTTNFNSEFNGR